jgi:integrase
MRTHIKGSIQKRGRSYRAFYWQSGKLRTATFRNERDARGWLLDLNNEIEPLVGKELADACAALRLLRDDCTLVDCVEYYNAHHIQAATIPLATIVATFLTERERELRPATIRNYRQVLNRALRAFNSLSEMTTESLKAWMKDETPDNRNRAIRALSAFFSWCIDNQYASTNPATNIRLSKTKSPTRCIFTLAEAKRYLSLAESVDPDTVPYVACCMFAGIRPEECVQLTKQHFTTQFIRVTEDIAKTHQARAIPIAPNLKAILAKYPVHKDGIACGYSISHFVKRKVGAVLQAYKDAGFEWANDIMRHSYASYEYERTKDAAATAANLGHTTTATMFKHYRGLVDLGLGAQYFAITL